MTIDELILEAKVTDTEHHGRFQYSVLDVSFADPKAQEAFDNLSEADSEAFFDAMSEKYCEEQRERGY